MGAEQEIEWVRGGECREEVGENGSGIKKDESGQEKRKGSGKDEEMREVEQKRSGKRRAKRE